MYAVADRRIARSCGTLFSADLIGAVRAGMCVHTDLSIATYYEGIKDYARAGYYYSTCGDYAKAVKLYLLCGESKLDDAIAVVKKAQGSAGSDLLTRAVLDYVTGETSATKQNPAFVYK